MMSDVTRQAGTYESSLLMCNVDDCTCPTCEFLNGRYTTQSLLEIIGNLDSALSGCEAFERNIPLLSAELLRERDKLSQLVAAFAASQKTISLEEWTKAKEVDSYVVGWLTGNEENIVIHVVPRVSEDV